MSKVPVYSHDYNSSSFICCYFIFPAAWLSGDRLDADFSNSSSSHFSSSGVLVLLLSHLMLDLMYLFARGIKELFESVY